ncbi:MAG: phosphoribosylaminoimidazolesuccinocarboxamide synthase [Opitutaceae bacterium]|nr:phosphoribosylaminoimidazolesuccinocarboxamide synthase [Opitutaceae bacterium]
MEFSQIVESLPLEPVCQVDKLPFPKIASGKVREIFDLGDRLLLVATDRISAFDVILPGGIAGKGIILTQLSRFWFDQIKGIGRDHLVADGEKLMAEELGLSKDFQLRSMVVKKLQPLPLECVVRGYLAGSGWTSYQESGEVCGVKLPSGLSEAERLPEVIFTPTTKAAEGHDEPIDEAGARALVGDKVYEEVRRLSFEIYERGHSLAKRAGIILADTKFEFGLNDAGDIYLIDEILTPDSSRYWPAETYERGMSPPSFDKQFVRDYLLTLDWDKQYPGPELPSGIIEKTRGKYLSALEKLMEVSER